MVRVKERRGFGVRVLGIECRVRVKVRVRASVTIRV